MWPETTIALTHFSDRSLISGQELVHDFDRSLIGVREHLPIRGNVPISWKLSDRLPFLFGKACYVFRSENALYGTGHIIGRMMIMKTALLLNTL